MAKCEWKDADGIMVPFRKNSKGELILDGENRPVMTMKVFDVKLEDISVY